VPNGHKVDANGNVIEGIGNAKGTAVDNVLLIPAVGAGGLPAGQCLKNDDGSAVP
jgi:hypothetical protein